MNAFRERVRHRRSMGPAERLRARRRAPHDLTLPIDSEAAIVRIVARTYPRAGNQLEAAAQLAARLGWAAAQASKGELP